MPHVPTTTPEVGVKAVDAFATIFGRGRGSEIAQAQRDRSEIAAARKSVIAAAEKAFAADIDDTYPEHVQAMAHYFSILDFDDEEFVERGRGRTLTIITELCQVSVFRLPSKLIDSAIQGQLDALTRLQPLLEALGGLIERLPVEDTVDAEGIRFHAAATLQRTVSGEALAGPLSSWVQAFVVRYQEGRMHPLVAKILQREIDDLQPDAVRRRQALAPLSAFRA